MEGKGQRAKKITSLALFGFSFFYLASSFRLKFGTARNPGPGLIPMVIGVLLLIMTTLYLIRVFREAPARAKIVGGAAGAGKNYRSIVGILACTIAYPLILETVKFVGSTFAVTLAMLILLKPQKLILSFVLAFILSVIFFLIFSRLFGVALPSGFFENFLFRIGG